MSAKKFKFNIIDAIILLIIIAAVAALTYVFIFNDKSDVQGEPHTVEYTIVVTSVDGKFKNSIQEDDSVTLESNRKLNLGKVVSYDYGGSVKTGFNEKLGDEAAEVYSVMDEDLLIDMVITFRAETEKTELGYCIDDEVYLHVNDPREFIIGDFLCVGTCTDLKVID